MHRLPRSLWLLPLLAIGCSAPPAPQASAVGTADASFLGHVPGDTVQRLLAGNERYRTGKARGDGRDAARRAEVATAQHPYAIVVTCADSRVSPEIVFDAGLGELFVVRSAGHVLDDHALGSIEYAAEHLHAHTLLVVGHERCGAVAAAMAGGELPGHIGSLVQSIQPGIAAANHGKDTADACVQANVAATVAALKRSQPLLAELVAKGELEVRGAVYDLDTGAVTMLDDAAPSPR